MKTTIHLHTKQTIAPVDPRLFGGFLEHMGRAVYEGIYDPNSKHADARGFRTDVLDALKRLHMTVIRYPGGNFVSGYNWMDGIGPKEKRPTVREMAWNSIEPNAIGTDEFMALCRSMNWTPMLAVNLGTGTPEQARNWVEYCNAPPGTRYADLRAANGHPDPHAVKLWCLGNEMDGNWQIGHVPADQYAIRAQQAAKMMKDIDWSIAVVACGSNSPDMPTYMEWDRIVLDYIGDWADYISLHRYVGNKDHNTPNYLAVTALIDRQIEEMDAVCRYSQARRRSFKRTYLCFDEWNVWYKNMEIFGEGTFAPHLIEEVYNLEDALVVAGFLNSFIRHADSVKIANIAQLVNVIAPILARDDELLIQSIFYPFAMMSGRRTGIALRMALTGPSSIVPGMGTVPYLDASAILNKGEVSVFASNRSETETMALTIDIADSSIGSLVSGELLTGPQAHSANSFENPTMIQPVPLEVRIDQEKAFTDLPPLSFAAMTFRLE